MIRKFGSFDVERREQMRGGPGTVTLEHLFHKDEFGGEHVRLCARLVIPPGSGIGPHEHDGEDEFFLILRGRAIVQDNETTAELGPGDTLLTGRGGSHSITCKGNETLEVLAFIVTY